MTDRVRRIHQVIEVVAPRWIFEGGFLDTAREGLAVLCHEEDYQMEHSQYRHFPSRAQDGANAVVIPTEGRDHIGCLANQVKLTRALDRDLDEATKEIK
jgi:hypothetical protein